LNGQLQLISLQTVKEIDRWLASDQILKVSLKNSKSKIVIN